MLCFFFAKRRKTRTNSPFNLILAGDSDASDPVSTDEPGSPDSAAIGHPGRFVSSTRPIMTCTRPVWHKRVSTSFCVCLKPHNMACGSGVKSWRPWLTYRRNLRIQSKRIPWALHRVCGYLGFRDIARKTCEPDARINTVIVIV